MQIIFRISTKTLFLKPDSHLKHIDWISIVSSNQFRQQKRKNQELESSLNKNVKVKTRES